jgi:hypothetical protein
VLGLGHVGRRELVEMPVATLNEIVSGKASPRRRAMFLHCHDLRLDRSRYARCDLVLNCKEIAELAGVPAAPRFKSASLNQPGRG